MTTLPPPEPLFCDHCGHPVQARLTLGGYVHVNGFVSCATQDWPTRRGMSTLAEVDGQWSAIREFQREVWRP